MSEVTYTVKGIHCQSCVDNISGEVGDLAGVQSVQVDREADRVVVHGDGFDDASVRAAIQAAGYEAA
ncbi:MAG: heavy-metal-associated domain-containing protein [Actinomycetota bacterium]|nr:heavy-metal-associated domain-containing protein [Actinomycetota bacterium]